MSADVKKTIMLADDDPEVLAALSRAVRMLGYSVVTASDGLEALQKLRGQRVDLLLSDIDMPEMDGVTLAAHARAEQLAPVRILLTANARLDTAMQAINGGEVHRYLTKPWRHDELAKTLADAFLRIDDLRRLHAADHAARRLRIACEALELEYAGLTYVEREDDAYCFDEKRALHALDLLDGTALAALVSTRLPA